MIDVAASVGTAIATIALVFLLYRTIKQMEATVNLSRIQTQYRFQSWIGPINGINKGDNALNNGKTQFEIGIKNYGEIPASAVTAMFKSSSTLLNRDEDQENLEKFSLGPMTPGMEKHYWFFIDSDEWKKVESGQRPLYTYIYFQYPDPSGKKGGYGMISQYIPESGKFVHKDMWIDYAKAPDV